VSATWYEVAFGPLYPVLYRHRDTEEAQRAVATFADLFEGRDPVFDVACGGGRYLDAFARRGVDALGMDLSETLLAEAAQSHGGRVARADMRRLPVRDESIGAAVNMFTSFGYFEDDAENKAVLGEIARVLRPGGILLLDFLNASRILAAPPGDTRRSASGYDIEELRSISDDDRTLIKRVRATPRAGGETVGYEERVRLFTRDALTTMASAAGLDVERTCGGYGGEPFDAARSDRLILVCRKRGRKG
jgi:SAM-dependent methyltransferase